MNVDDVRTHLLQLIAVSCLCSCQIKNIINKITHLKRPFPLRAQNVEMQTKCAKKEAINTIDYSSCYVLHLHSFHAHRSFYMQFTFIPFSLHVITHVKCQSVFVRFNSCVFVFLHFLFTSFQIFYDCRFFSRPTSLSRFLFCINVPTTHLMLVTMNTFHSLVLKIRNKN